MEINKFTFATIGTRKTGLGKLNPMHAIIKYDLTDLKTDHENRIIALFDISEKRHVNS